ncbi:MAG: hypothetical protein EON60_01625 [Alphaproteobacteria bacterium]|nr:MAG: hypothetical protein EON60_01625 [Alphaproteobacteria bacterium]
MTTPRYIAFHNSKSIHAAVVARYEDSARLRQGTGYDWKTGCGCLLGLLLNEFHTNRIGQLFEEETNLPAPLAHVLNLAFETTSPDMAEDLPAMFFGTLATGAVADNFMLGLVNSTARLVSNATREMSDVHRHAVAIQNLYSMWYENNGNSSPYYRSRLLLRQEMVRDFTARKVPLLSPEDHWWYTQLDTLAGIAEDDTLASHHLLKILLENNVLPAQKLINMLMQEVLATPEAAPLAA